MLGSRSTLRLLGGLTTEEIARAFLVPEPTIAQRIVRAKRTLSEAQIPFEVPRRGPNSPPASPRPCRSSTSYSTKAIREPAAMTGSGPELCEDALRLGRVLAELVPEEPEVHGLVGLMEIQASRAAARVDAGGDPILLLDQNRALWYQILIRRGLAALERSEARSPKHSGAGLGPYALQAAIASCHARALAPPPTPIWPRIAALYDALAQSWRPRRWWSSIAPSRSRWPSGPLRRVSRSSWSPYLRTLAQELSPVAERPGRPACQGWPIRGGLRRIRAGRRHSAQRSASETVARAGCCVRSS